MKLSTTKEKLLQAIAIVERIVGKKESLPILSCILIDAGKELTIKATNLEAGIEVSVPCDVGEKGVVAIPAGILSQTVRSTLGDKMTLLTEEANLVIESKGARTLIKAIPHDEFPAMGANPKGDRIRLPREALYTAIQSVVYAASPSMIRPELGSVYVALDMDGIVCVATDSFRLAEKKVPASFHDVERTDILIPLKHAVELTHILERIASDTVELSMDESQLIVVGDGVRYISRIIDGTFPNYKEIVPKSYVTEVTLLKGDFAEMLRKARVFSGSDQYVGLHAYPKKKVFSATARSADIGEMSDSMDAAIEGEDLDINFHIGYLSDCLQSIESDSITLSFAGIGRGLVIRGVSDHSYMYLVMPLNR